MSGLVAVWHRDDARVDPARVSSMLAALAHRGPDGFRWLLRPQGALGHQHFWTTPEEVGETQPVSSEAAGVDLVFDGRLDNRDELLAALDECDPSISDAVLLLKAYEAWGEACFERLLGPFAAVIVDARKRRLVAARDGMGTRSLYYRCSPNVALLASEECALLAHPDVERRLDEAALAEFFAVDVPRDGSTFFKGVTELLPAHVLLVTPEAVRLRRFWRPDQERRIQYWRDREYSEHFRSLLSESVRCRLRAVGPPGLMLSGGMDSTSVAALAAEELGRRGAGPLLTFSWVFDEVSECDERPWITPMVERFGLDATFVRGDDDWPLRDVDGCPVGSNQPWYNCFEQLKQRLYRAVEARGCRTLLNPVFSDCYYTGDEDWLTDLLREGHLLQFSRHVLGILRGQGAAALRDIGIRRLGRNVLRAGDPDTGGGRKRPAWLTDRAWQLLGKAGPVVSSSARRPDQLEALFGPLSWLNANLAQHTHAHGIERRDPFRDRRLVEFALALPAHQLYRAGRTKYVQRNAMSDLLPPGVVNRTAYTGLEPLFRRGLAERGRASAQAILSRKDAIWRPYVLEDWALGSLEAQRAAHGRESLVAWQCISAQLWIDRVAPCRVA